MCFKLLEEGFGNRIANESTPAIEYKEKSVAEIAGFRVEVVADPMHLSVEQEAPAIISQVPEPGMYALTPVSSGSLTSYCKVREEQTKQPLVIMKKEPDFKDTDEKMTQTTLAPIDLPEIDAPMVDKLRKGIFLPPIITQQIIGPALRPPVPVVKELQSSTGKKSSKAPAQKAKEPHIQKTFDNPQGIVDPNSGPKGIVSSGKYKAPVAAPSAVELARRARMGRVAPAKALPAKASPPGSNRKSPPMIKKNQKPLGPPPIVRAYWPTEPPNPEDLQAYRQQEMSKIWRLRGFFEIGRFHQEAEMVTDITTLGEREKQASFL